MNKTSLKNFAIWARNKLIADISYRVGLMGITADGVQKALPQSTSMTEFYDIGTAEPYSISGEAIKQRKHLVELIRRKEKDTNYKTAYKYVLEEVAYTWFNRLIAVRFMEVNDYLPSHIRVLSSDSGKMEPDLVTNPFSAGLPFTSDEEQVVYQLKQDNKLDEVFRILFIKQCNALNENLPALFEKTNDYTELLLNISVIDQDGVVYHLVHDIPEENFDVERGGQVEIIGWLYQYYISEPKDVLINARKKYKKNEIPFVTQLFTPDWIVRYMVENSLGRLWVEGHPNDELKAGWKYYLEEIEQEPEVQEKLVEIRSEYAKLNPKDIKVIDPCMGSGHILVYAFDVLMQIYESTGYSQRDAARSILENNLYGLDIDDRAFQMAYFAVMMKARQYNRRILNGDYKPNIYSIQDSSGINRNQLKYFGASLNELEKNNAITQMTGLLDIFKNSKEYGSILTVDQYDWELLERFVSQIKTIGQLSFEAVGLDGTAEQLNQLIVQGKVLSQKYNIVTTNPPYMSSSLMPDGLKRFLSEKYVEFKNDLFSVFTKRIQQMCVPNAHVGMLTPYVWMFISSYEKMRNWFNKNNDITSLIQLEYNAFEAACVPVAAFTFVNGSISRVGEYIKLSEFRGAENQAPRTLYAVSNASCDYRYSASQKNYKLIPGEPFAFWLSNSFYETFQNPKLGEIARPVEGIKTGDNERFLRLWFEPKREDVYLSFNDQVNRRWYKMTKGGEFRRWYGNLDYVCEWSGTGAELKRFKGSAISNTNLYFSPAFTWTYLTSSLFSARYVGNDTLYNNKGPGCYVKAEDLWYLLALMNSKVVQELLTVLAPTIDYKPGNLSNVPIAKEEIEKVDRISKECWEISKCEWDSFEESWDFKRHPLI